MAAAKPKYEDSASLADLKERQKDDYVPPGVVTQASDQELSDNGFIATDPIYQGRASHTDRPYPVDEKSPEGKVASQFLSDDVEYDTGEPEESGDAKASPSGGSTPPSSQS